MKALSRKIQNLEESQTLTLTEAANRLKASGVDIVSLTAGEPDFPTPAHVKIAAIQAIEENFTHYTPLRGIPSLLKAIVTKFERDNNIHFDPSQILVSVGAKHSIINALQAICNKGDEVVIPAPFWVSYPEMVKLVDALPVIVPTTRESNFKITARQLRKATNDKTKALLLNTPANPTGAVYSQGELEELADVVRDTGIFVIADEIYEKVMYPPARHFSIGSIKQVSDQVITVNGVSKAYAMTGWRIGYLGAAASVTEAAAKVQSQMTSNATSIAQRAAVAALTGPTTDIDAMVCEFERRRNFLVSEFSKIPGIDFVNPQGSFHLFPSVKSFIGKRVKGSPIRNDADFCHYLIEEEHLALVPGSAFGIPDHVRLSYATSMKELEKGVERFKSGCRKLNEAY